MELRQLKYFKGVADAGSFVHAAKYLRVAQPALSRSIAKLEEEFGRSLFIRHNGGVTLTDAGDTFYNHAAGVLERARELKDKMLESDASLRGHLTLGAPQSVQAKMITPIVSSFLKRFPHCTLDLFQDSSSKLSEKILDGTLDLAILSQKSVHGSMHEVRLMTENICLFARAGDFVPDSEVAALADIARLPLIVCGYPSGLREGLERELRRYNRSPTIRSDVNAASLMLDLVMNGVGVGLAPSCVSAQERADNLQVIPISGLEISWSLATSWGKSGSRIANELGAMITDHVKQTIADGRWPNARAHEET